MPTDLKLIKNKMINLASLRKSYPVSTEIKVRWGEMDAFQHLNNTVYIRYIEDSRIDLFEKLGIGDDMQTSHIGPVLAAIQCNYLAPVTYPDTIIVFTSATQTGPKKVELEHKLWSVAQTKVVAQGKSLGVYYDHKALKSCIIPAFISAKLKALNDI